MDNIRCVLCDDQIEYYDKFINKSFILIKDAVKIKYYRCLKCKNNNDKLCPINIESSSRCNQRFKPYLTKVIMFTRCYLVYFLPKDIISYLYQICMKNKCC